MIKRRRASRRRYQRPRAATLLALLVGLSVTWGTCALTLRGKRIGAPVKSGVERPLAARSRAAFGRRALQRCTLAAYLLGASIVGGPLGANAGSPFDFTSHIALGISQAVPRVAARVREVQAEAGRAAIARAALSGNTDAVARLVTGPQREPTKMPPRETVTVASVAGTTVYRESNPPTPAPVTAMRGVATWYGGVDGFDLGDGMADGTPFNPDDPTIAASNQWPLGTRLMVCHGERCIPVCVRDRGGFSHAVDLSRAAFALLAPLSSGVIDVTIEASP